MAVEALQNGKVLIHGGSRAFNDGLTSAEIKNDSSTNLYGEYVIKRETPNIDVNELAGLLVDKIGFPGVKRTEAIEVDIQKEISIGKVDKNAVKSEVTVGPVNNRIDKLRELRRNGR